MQISLSAMGRIVAAPWQQRINQSGVLLSLLMPVMILLPLAIFSGVLLVHGMPGDDRLPFALRLFVCVFAFAGVAALWGMTINNVLEQNHPVYARLVPGHAKGLRRTVFVGWGVLVVCGGVLPGLALGAPFACTAAVGSVLALIAVFARWPQLALGVPVLVVLNLWLPREVMQALRQWASAWWRADSALSALATLVVSAGLLALIVQRGGSRHIAAYAARRDRNCVMRARANGDLSIDFARGGFGGWSGWPYFWWLRRELARRDSTARSRLLLGLGPSLHWTTRLASTVLVALGFGAGCVVAVLTSPDAGVGMMGGAAIGVLFTIALPALQVHSALWKTRGEQALLVLLPGAPRGGTLNRWLGEHMSVHFALGLLGAFAVSFGLRGAAMSLGNDWSGGFLDGIALMCAAAILPLGQLVWRRWHRIAAPTSVTPFLPLLWAVGLGIVLAVLHWVAGIGMATLVTACFAASVLWCVLRWRGAAHEPVHFPVGRAAR